MNGTGLIAWRHEDEYSNGYVFTGEPLRAGERIVVQILATENMYIGSLAFGLTSCDPASLDPERLPEDSDMLLDRSEYWVVSKVGQMRSELIVCDVIVRFVLACKFSMIVPG